MPELRKLALATAIAVAAATAFATAQYLFLERGTVPPPPPERPPGPLLQVAPRSELERLRREQARRLETYGWTDRARGLVRVPIERAMDLLLEDPRP